MSVSVNRTVRRAIEATVVERARSRAVEQAIAIGMIVAIGAMAMPMLGESGPASAHAGNVDSAWESTTRTSQGPQRPRDQNNPQSERHQMQGWRDGDGQTTR